MQPTPPSNVIHAEISRLEVNRLLALFDFPDPNVHSAGRVETTTPLQKLFVLNSPFMIRQAQYQAEVETQKAKANQAGPLSEAMARQAVVAEEVRVDRTRTQEMISVQEQEVLRRQKELEATVIKPAEADRQAAIVRAEAAKQAAILEAEGRRSALIALAEAEQEKLRKEGAGRAAAVEAEGKAEAAKIDGAAAHVCVVDVQSGQTALFSTELRFVRQRKAVNETGLAGAVGAEDQRDRVERDALGICESLEVAHAQGLQAAGHDRASSSVGIGRCRTRACCLISASNSCMRASRH